METLPINPDEAARLRAARWNFWVALMGLCAGVVIFICSPLEILKALSIMSKHGVPIEERGNLLSLLLLSMSGGTLVCYYAGVQLLDYKNDIKCWWHEIHPRFRSMLESKKKAQPGQ